MGVLLIVGFIAMMIVEYVRGDDEGFEPIDGQVTLTKNAWKNWFGERMEIASTPKGQRVLCDWYRYKGMVATQDAGWLQVGEQLNADLMDLVMETSISAHYWAEVSAFEQLYPLYDGNLAAKSSIVAQCESIYPDIAQKIDTDVESFKQLAQREGFLDAESHILASKRDIVHLLHRHLWVKQTSEQFPRNRIEPPEERLAFFRWQVEQSQLSPEDRIRKIVAFRAAGESDYDDAFAVAKIDSENGMFAESCAILQEALRETPSEKTFRRERYQRMLDRISQAHPASCAHHGAQ